jgi:hypothetical protein
VALFVRELAPRAWLQEHRLLVRGGALIVGVVLLAIAAAGRKLLICGGLKLRT